MPDASVVALRRRSAQRVLVIDDDPKVGEVVRLILEAEGFQLVATADASGGLRAMGSGPFAIALVDLFMPGMDGLQTTRKLRELDPALPVVAMSGFLFAGECPRMPQFSAMAEEAGAVATLYKPFRPHELLQVVRDAMAA